VDRESEPTMTIDVLTVYENEQAQMLKTRMAHELKRHLADRHGKDCETCRVFLKTLFEPHSFITRPDDDA
jgi:hypothetical protein